MSVLSPAALEALGLRFTVGSLLRGEFSQAPCGGGGGGGGGVGEYVLVRTDVGLFFPAVGSVRDAVLRAADHEAGGRLPVVLDCTYFRGLDYTAVKVSQHLCTPNRAERRRATISRQTER